MIATNLTSSVVSVWRKFLKRLILKNVASIQIQKVLVFNTDCKKINLIPNKSFRNYNLLSSIILNNLLGIKLIFFLNLYGRYVLWYESVPQFSPYRHKSIELSISPSNIYHLSFSQTLLLTLKVTIIKQRYLKWIFLTFI